MSKIKITNWLLVFFILVLFISPLSAVRAESETQTNVEKYAKVLYDLGYIENADNYVKNPKEYVTRAEVAFAAARMCGENIVADNPFVDVFTNDWAYEEIISVRTKRIMIGISDKEFSPQTEITLGDASKVFARVLCSDALLFNTPSVEEKIILSVANKITKKIQSPIALTNEAFLTLLMNVIDSNVLETTTIGLQGSEIESTYGKTLLSANHDIEKVEGIVTSNSETSLTSSYALGEEYIKIGNKQYFIGQCSDLKNYLGYNIVAFINMASGNEEVVTFYETKNEVLKINAEEINSVNGWQIKYSQNNKYKTEKLSKDIDIIYNGVMLANVKDSDIHIKDGYLILLDNNSDGNYDVLKIYSTVDYLVSGIDWTNKKIYDELGKSPLSFGKDVNASYQLLDEYISFEEFKKILSTGDVVTVSQSKNTVGKKSVVLSLRFDKIDGTFEEKSGDNESIRVDGTEYFLSGALKEQGSIFSTFQLGDTIRIYLNAHEKVCYIEKGENQDGISEKVGYLFAFAPENALGRNVQFEIFDDSGEFVILKAASKVRFNKGKGASPKELYKLLTDAGVTQQLITYTVDENNNLIRLNTATVGKDDNKFSHDINMKNAHYFSDNNSMFYSREIGTAFLSDYDYDCSTHGVEYGLGVDSKILYINGRDENGKVLEDKIRWISSTDLDEDYNNVDMYDIDDSGVAGVVVIEDSADIKPNFRLLPNKDYIVVTDLVFKQNADVGDYVLYMKGFECGAEVEYAIHELNVVECPETLGTYVTTQYDVSNYAQYIAKGDVIQGVVSDNELRYFRRVFTLADRGENSDKAVIFANEGFSEVAYDTSSNGKTAAVHLAIYGQVVSRNGSNIYVKTLNEGEEMYRCRMISSNQTTDITVLTKTGNEFVASKGTVNDIEGGKEFGTIVLLHSRLAKLEDVIIFKLDE